MTLNQELGQKLHEKLISLWNIKTKGVNEPTKNPLADNMLRIIVDFHSLFEDPDNYSLEEKVYCTSLNDFDFAVRYLQLPDYVGIVLKRIGLNLEDIFEDEDLKRIDVKLLNEPADFNS